MADILVIDDDTSIRGTVRRILERAGHEVREAEDGGTGLDEVERTVPDLVIIDLIMPGKEGIETILELRERHPDLPVLAMSGGGRVDPTGPLGDAEVFGADASLAKPFSVERLQQTVERLLG